MKLFFALFIAVTSHQAFATDCSTIKPFLSKGKVKVQLTVAKLSWKNGRQVDEDVCNGNLTIPIYDVRKREDEAFYCLQPNESQVLACKTDITTEAGQIEIVPATWIRGFNGKSFREYRFHAYVSKNQQFEQDIFSRTLNTQLASQNIYLEGATKNSEARHEDGYFLRVEFQK